MIPRESRTEGPQVGPTERLALFPATAGRVLQVHFGFCLIQFVAFIADSNKGFIVSIQNEFCQDSDEKSPNLYQGRSALLHRNVCVLDAKTFPMPCCEEPVSKNTVCNLCLAVRVYNPV